QLKQRVESGARVLLTADVNQMTEVNDFLSTFGLSTTSHRILASDPDSSALTIRRQSDCFVDQDLLDGVEAVVFNSVAAVAFERDALPVLFAPESTWAVDLAADLPVEWNRREVGCISRWQGSTGGAVVLLGGNIFWDMSRRSTNLSIMPGI